MLNKKLKAILLVAGEGRRLRPYTLDRPKCLVEINEKSLLDRQIEILESEGINNIVLIGGYKAEMLKNKGNKLKINTKFFETNMVWTLFSAEEELEGSVIVSYGDIVYSQEVLKKLINSKEDIAVVIDKDWESYWRARNEDPLDDAETLRVDQDGRICDIGNRPSTIEEVQGQYIGLMKFSPKGLSYIKKIFNNSIGNGKLLNKPIEVAYMTDLLQACINEDFPVSSIEINGGWVEIDTVSDLHSKTTKERIEILDKLK